ncbi:MAG: leucine-rich repeat domain-containing protein [Butyribacter sp.]|nr:leucine-rich repeat domain-containing protein [bacterium]MDY3854518.1 leucine-rich repeat domain-containing protein [Butyribacter sp.]
MVLCMVFSLFTGVPARADEGESSTVLPGLRASNDLVWGEDGVPNVASSESYGKELWSWITGTTVHMLYRTSEGVDENVAVSDLSVTLNGNEMGIDIHENTTNYGMYDIAFPEPDEYTITYKGKYASENAEDNTIVINVVYPEIAFYGADTISPQNIFYDREFVCTDLNKESQNSFYMILNSEVDKVTLADENPIEVFVWDDDAGNVKVDNINDYITYEEVSGKPGAYKITVKKDQNFGIVVHGVATSEEGESRTVENDIQVKSQPAGFVMSWPNWSPDPETGDFVLDGGHDTEYYFKSVAYDIYDIVWLWLGEVDKDYKDATPLSKEAFMSGSGNQIKINGKTDYTVIEDKNEDDVYKLYKADKCAVIADEDLAANGIYGFYVKDDYTIEYGDEIIEIKKQLPAVGFYKGNKATFENYIRHEYTLTDDDRYLGMDIYVLPREGMQINEYTLETPDQNILVNGQKFVCSKSEDGDWYVSDTVYGEPIKISVSDCSESYLFMKGTYGQGEPMEFDSYVGLVYPDAENEATGIKVVNNPTKTSYVEGETFDAAGMKVVLVKKDGTTTPITSYTCSSTGALKAGESKVTVSYGNFKTEVAIKVSAKAAEQQKTSPKVGTNTTTTNGSCKVTAVGSNGKVEVTFTPSKANKKAKKVKIDKQVTINGKVYAVTAIAANAFSGNTKMTSVSIPSTVTKIGKNAFKGCTSLKSVTIPKNVTELGSGSLTNCKKLKKVTFKSTKIKKIGTNAFKGCTNLKSVAIPKNVTELGSNSFSGCKKLGKITITSTKIKKIGKNAFKGISKKSVIKVPKSKKAAYKKLLKKAGYKGTVK